MSFLDLPHAQAAFMADFDNVAAYDYIQSTNLPHYHEQQRRDSLVMNGFSDTYDPIKGTRSLPPPQLPQLVAEQHMPIPSHDKDSRRLVVVLSNASLETYRAAHSSARAGGRPGVVRDEKFTLLNSDEHIGIMRKMGRDISDARPDITHHVRRRHVRARLQAYCACRTFINLHLEFV